MPHQTPSRLLASSLKFTRLAAPLLFAACLTGCGIAPENSKLLRAEPSNSSFEFPSTALSARPRPIGPPPIGYPLSPLQRNPPFTAMVKAGSQPISGASVQLYAAGTTGSGSAPTPLLPYPLLTDTQGVVSGYYTCPSPGSLVYAIASGGTVSGAPAADPAIRFMTAFGPCGNLASSPSVVVDEATTVAAMYALSQFYAAPGNIGASATNRAGITNAFALAAALANSEKGTIPGRNLPPNAVAPTARIHSLANLLNTCAVSPACPFLATTATSDAFAALHALTQSPAANVAALFTASQTSSAYAPALATAPAD